MSDATIPLTNSEVLDRILIKGRDLSLCEADVQVFLDRYRHVYDMGYRKRYTKEVSWAFFTLEYANSLARLLRGKRVLEVCAGNGTLARMMQQRGIEWVATDILTPSCSMGKGVVKCLLANHAVVELQGQYDVLYGSWLPYHSTLDVELLAHGVPLILLGARRGEGSTTGSAGFWERDGADFISFSLPQKFRWFQDSPPWHRIDTSTRLILPRRSKVLLDGQAFMGPA